MKMRVCYSGEENKAVPEVVLGDKANLMLTFWEVSTPRGVSKRFRRIIKARKRAKGKKRVKG
jgi:hypothetical protein